MNRLPILLGLASVTWLACRGPVQAAEPTPPDSEFFEKRIRPLLVEHCFKCHSNQAKRPKGGLRLDSREALLKGGDNGPALVPRQPQKSRLIEAVGYKNPDLQMPPKGKLPEAAIADLVAWVKMAAPWPDDKVAKSAEGKYRFDLPQRKRAHWAWQPLQSPPVPAVKDRRWPRAPLDHFILARLEENGISPASPADRRTLMRRVSFDLIGLPPEPAEVEAFLADDAPNAFEKVVDRLLGSPRFGERWGRHWLDLVRYGETRGHEFDYTNPNAYQYRDYVIRAFNADVPYDQFVAEHLAGDMLDRPRRHPKEGFNESILGTGFWFLGEQVHSPVDICQDKADRFDNMLDVMSKTFLALTVACARCHDHKFDAISTKDYYALSGFLESSSYRLVRFDTMEQERRLAEELQKLRERGRRAVQRALAETAEPATNRLAADPLAAGNDDPPLKNLKGVEVIVDYANPGPEDWLPDGFTFGLGPVRPGEILLSKGEARVVERAAAMSDPAWDHLKLAPGTENDPGALGGQVRAGRTIRTPTFEIKFGKVFCLVQGSGRGYAAVEAHVMINGPLHGQLVLPIKTGPEFQWVTYDLAPYQGRRAHLEFTPAEGADFAVALVVQGEIQPDSGRSRSRLGLMPPRANHLFAGTDAKARLGKIVQSLVEEQAKLFSGAKLESRLALAMMDGSGVNERVFIRGTYKAPGELAPRRFLEALAGPEPLAVRRGSGRLDLARQMTDPKLNPFLPRVMVNRAWHHLFGKGIVASVDNFGVLGERPTHPELLDHLAQRFVREGWSIKKLVRELVLSSAYQMSCQEKERAGQIDPDNKLWHRRRLRRLEGEAIRDALLAVSGRLNERMYGPSVPVYLTAFQDGRGRPASGPLDGDGRRSLYLAVRRNFLSSLLLAFDAPIPFATVGRRTVSNVPAQALILMNDPFVHQQAEVWARRVLSGQGSEKDRISLMYQSAFSRPPTADELTACLEFLRQQGGARRAAPEASLVAWTNLAHVLFNAKEFIFID